MKITQIETKEFTFVLGQRVHHREVGSWRGRITQFYIFGDGQLSIGIENGRADVPEKWLPDKDRFALFLPMSELKIYIECGSFTTFPDIENEADFVEMRDAKVKIMVPFHYDTQIRDILVEKFKPTP